MGKLLWCSILVMMMGACAPSWAAGRFERGEGNSTFAPAESETHSPFMAPSATVRLNPTITSTFPPTVTYSPTARFTATPSLTITASSSPTPRIAEGPSPTLAGSLIITTIHYDGRGEKEPDEYVELRNDSPMPIALKGWTLEDKAKHRFTFPDFVIQPGQVCRVYTNEIHPESCGFSFRFGRTAIWNNGGDCAYLRDAQGKLIVEYCY